MGIGKSNTSPIECCFVSRVLSHVRFLLCTCSTWDGYGEFQHKSHCVKLTKGVDFMHDEVYVYESARCDRRPSLKLFASESGESVNRFRLVRAPWTSLSPAHTYMNLHACCSLCSNVSHMHMHTCTWWWMYMRTVLHTNICMNLEPAVSLYRSFLVEHLDDLDDVMEAVRRIHTKVSASCTVTNTHLVSCWIVLRNQRSDWWRGYNVINHKLVHITSYSRNKVITLFVAVAAPNDCKDISPFENSP